MCLAKLKNMPKKKSNRGFATTSIPSKSKKEQICTDNQDKSIKSITLETSVSSNSNRNALDTLSKQDLNAFQKDIRLSVKKTQEDISRDREICDKLANDELIPVLSLPYETDSKLYEVYEKHVNHVPGLHSKKSNASSLQNIAYAYMMLEELQFPADWIEKALKEAKSNDLDHIIYWLCLNCPPELLPPSWSENRFYFQAEGQSTPSYHGDTPSKDLVHHMDKSNQTLENKASVSQDTFDAKGWILNRLSSDEDQDNDDSGLKFYGQEENVTTMEKYVSCLIRMEDLRRIGAEAKARKDKETRSKAGKELKSLCSWVDTYEFELRKRYPDFDNLVKEQLARQMCPSSETNNRAVPDSGSQSHENTDETDAYFTENLFAESEEIATTSKKSELATEKVTLMTMNMGSWTGQKPSNLFNSFVKRNYGCDVSFYTLQSSHPLGFRSGVQFKNVPTKVKLPFHKMEMSKTEVVDSKYSAKDYVAVKALYHISRDSHSLLRMLPSCYISLWQEWDQVAQDQNEKDESRRTVRRDNFLAQWHVKAKLKQGLRSSDNLESHSRYPAVSKQQRKNYNVKESERIRDTWNNRKKSGQYLSLLEIRKELPVYQMKQQILSALHSNQIIIVCGQTGSGKSTQVPQFIMESALQSELIDTRVVCTQPRRISALSLATRVSLEMGDSSVGTEDSFVGYQVRLEKKVTANTRLIYLTTGVILRKLEVDPTLSDITHIVVDEVHERTLDSDLLLFLLRNLLRQRRDLKLILMSATMEAAAFARYFDDNEEMVVPVVDVPGRSHPVQAFFLEDIVQMTNYVLDVESEYALRQSDDHQQSRTLHISTKGSNKVRLRVVWNDAAIDKADRDALAFPSDDNADNQDNEEGTATVFDGEGDLSERNYTQKTLDTVIYMSPTKINFDLIETLILYISNHPEWSQDNGSILVFLPGIAEIRRLQEQLTLHTSLWILPLHSTLDAADQALVFENAPKGMRKIVLSTNVAETGITIPDAIFVIDSVRSREVSYDEKRKVTRLKDVFVSQANCKQRRGRAGRVRPGFCFHLIPKSSFDKLPLQRPPEMVRLPLEEVVLRCRAIETSSCLPVSNIFESMLDSPPKKHVEQAVDFLKLVTALDGSEKLTDLGRFVVGLPIDVRLGRMLLYGVLLKCLDPILTICAALSLGKSIFTKPFGQDVQASLAHAKFRSGESDLLSYVNAFAGWVNAGKRSKSEMRRFCAQNYLSFTNLWAIESIREELVQALLDTTVLSVAFHKFWRSNRKLMTAARLLPDQNQYATSTPVILAALGAGLYPNLLLTNRNKFNSYGPVHLVHPESSSLRIMTHHNVQPQQISRGGWYTYYNARSDTRQQTTKKLVLLDLNRTLSSSIILLGAANLEYKPRYRLLRFDSHQVQVSPRTGALLVFVKELVQILVHNSVVRSFDSERWSNETNDSLVDTIVFLMESEAQSW